MQTNIVLSFCSLQDAFDYLIEYLEQPGKTFYVYEDSPLFYITQIFAEVGTKPLHLLIDNEHCYLRTDEAKKLK